MKKRLLAGLLTIALTITAVPEITFARTFFEQADTATASQACTFDFTIDNRLHAPAGILADGEGVAVTEAPTEEEMVNAPVVSSAKELGTVLREQVNTHNERIIVDITALGDLDKVDALCALFEETGNFKEGAFLRGITYAGKANTWTISEKHYYTLWMQYAITLEEQEEMEQLIAEAEAYLQPRVQKLTDESRRFWEIYRYIREHCVYDEEAYQANITGAELTKEQLYAYSPYGVLKNGKAVCQGMTVLLYRLCNDLGIASYCASSGTHTWNAVKCDNEWYMCDVTNDLDTLLRQPKFFLLAKENMEKLSSEYDSTKGSKALNQALEGLNWASMNHDNILASTVRGFKKTVTITKANAGKLTNLIVKDIFGNTLKEGKDYKLKYEDTNSIWTTDNKRVTVVGIGDYKGMSNVSSTYLQKLQTPKITKITRSAKYLETSSLFGDIHEVTFKVYFTAVPGADWYEPLYCSLFLDDKKFVKVNKNTMCCVLKTKSYAIPLAAGGARTTINPVNFGIAAHDNDSHTSSESKVYRLPKNKNKITFKN